jgi:hypothetical protein
VGSVWGCFSRFPAQLERTNKVFHELAGKVAETTLHQPHNPTLSVPRSGEIGARQHVPSGLSGSDGRCGAQLVQVRFCPAVPSKLGCRKLVPTFSVRRALAVKYYSARRRLYHRPGRLERCGGRFRRFGRPRCDRYSQANAECHHSKGGHCPQAQETVAHEGLLSSPVDHKSFKQLKLRP